MPTYDYKTVAAPRRPRKVRGVKGKDAQMAHLIEELIKEQAAAGWDYLRTDLFPVEEGGGLFGKMRIVNRAVLVFRRAGVGGVTAPPPPHVPASAPISTPFSPAPQQQAQAPAEPQMRARQQAPQPAQPVPNEPGFSIAGVAPPKAPPVGSARDD